MQASERMILNVLPLFNLKSLANNTLHCIVPFPIKTYMLWMFKEPLYFQIFRGSVVNLLVAKAGSAYLRRFSLLEHF